MTGRLHGPQASRLVGLLRTRGPLSTDAVRDALGHAHGGAVGRHLGDLEAAARAAVWAITEHGRTVA